MNRKLTALMASLCSLLFLFSNSDIKAQTIVPASFTESPMDLHNFSYACSSHAELSWASTLNADIVKTVSGDKLWVAAYTAWDNNIYYYPTPAGCGTPGAPEMTINQIHVEYTGTTNLNPTNRDYPIPGAISKPDVVIGCAQAWGTQQFRLGVVYNAAGGNVELRTYQLTGIGGTTPVLNAPSAAITLNNPANGRFATDPHIDLFGDVQNTVGGRPSLHKYIAVWNERDNNGIWYVMAAVGDLNSPSTFTRYQITPNNPGDPQGRYPDVGAWGGGPNRGYIVFYDPTTGNNEVNLATLNLTVTPTISITNAYSVATNTYSGEPRIDAQSVPGSGAATGIWQFVASAQDASGNNFVECVNNNFSYQFSLGGSDEYFSPVVGLGAGALDAGVAYYSTYTYNGPGNGDIWAHKTPQSTTPVTSTLNQYLEANQIDLRNPAPYTNANDIPIAFANAPNSNTGQDIFTVWFEGYDPLAWKPLAGMFFRYKINSSYTYRPTDVNEVKGIETEVLAYPNPATDKINISTTNRTEGAIATLTDVSGRIVRTIDINNDNTEVNVADLGSGIYLLQYKDAKTSKSIKLIKE